MTNRLLAICIAAALGLTTAVAEVAAKGLAVPGKAVGWHAAHAMRHHPRHWHWPYRSVFVAGQTTSEPVASTPQPSSPVIQAAYALKCGPSEEFKVVPSEDGGTREIKIRRC